MPPTGPEPSVESTDLRSVPLFQYILSLSESIWLVRSCELSITLNKDKICIILLSTRNHRRQSVLALKHIFYDSTEPRKLTGGPVNPQTAPTQSFGSRHHGLAPLGRPVLRKHVPPSILDQVKCVQRESATLVTVFGQSNNSITSGHHSPPRGPSLQPCHSQ